MSLLIQYLVKLFIGLAIVWIFYQLVLRRLTFYNANRWYLLSCTLLAFFIPFINIAPVVNNNEGTESAVARLIPTVQQYTLGLEEAAHCPVPIWSTGYDKWGWLSFALMAGAAFFLIRFIIRCISFFRMQRTAKLISTGNVNLYQVDKDIIPFSFGNSIFINRQLHNDTELQEIIRHEFVHVKQKHTHDIIWGELLCIVNWYNPFAWLIRNAIRQNLEFIADNKVLENGLDKKQYQYLLLKVIGNRHFSIANQFNFSSLKKRIAMMNKMKSARKHLFKFLFLLPLIVILLFAFRTRTPQDKNQQQTSKPKSTNTAKPVNKKTDAMIYPDTLLWISNTEGIVKIGDLDKLIGIDGSGDFFNSLMDGKRPTDTIPEEFLNDKGYYIQILNNKGERTVIVWNKNKKEVARMPYKTWREKEDYYENLYGEILIPPPPPAPAPPPPPPPSPEGTNLPAPPAPPASPVKVESDDYAPPPPPAAPVKLPAGVTGISVNNHKATVTLENGTVERYNLDNAGEKKKFHDKYGEMPTPPEPPKVKPVRAAPRTVSAPVRVSASVTTPVELTISPAVETISVKPTLTNIKITPAVETIKLTPVVTPVKVKTATSVESKVTVTPEVQ